MPQRYTIFELTRQHVMNKKIYFNNKFIEFTGDTAQTSQNQQIRFYPEFSEQLLKEILPGLLSETDERLSQNLSGYATSSTYFQMVFDFLKKNLYYIEAAGGLIKKADKFLFIYRFERWDLPKGKLDKGETIENAAIRECEEECAVRGLSIQQQLSSTFHVYKYKDGHALKQTYWFYMTTSYNEKLIPQTEENITDVKWFDKNEIKEIVFDNSYFTIKDVVKEAFEEKKI
jgi:8-oxo-dGTP pyrophosphatase MutT (NUDIX family)